MISVTLACRLPLIAGGLRLSLRFGPGTRPGAVPDRSTMRSLACGKQSDRIDIIFRGWSCSCVGDVQELKKETLRLRIPAPWLDKKHENGQLPQID
jgi:hypothetical protein